MPLLQGLWLQLLAKQSQKYGEGGSLNPDLAEKRAGRRLRAGLLAARFEVLGNRLLLRLERNDLARLGTGLVEPVEGEDVLDEGGGESAQMLCPALQHLAGNAGGDPTDDHLLDLRRGARSHRQVGRG